MVTQGAHGCRQLQGQASARSHRARAASVALLLVAAAILAAWGGAAGSNGAVEIEIIPSPPTTEDPTVLVLSGTWKDSCVPQAPEAMILGSQITITTSNPSEVCLTVLTPWQLAVLIGTLSSPG